MHSSQRTMCSAYMEWVKTQTGVAFNLANSGVKNYSLIGLPVNTEALTLCGPGAYGYAPLKKAIAAKCGVPEDCVVTAQGTSMANYLAMAALVEPGDCVLIEHPAYPLLWEAAQFAGAEVKFFERPYQDRFAVDPQAIRKLLTPRTRLIVLTNLHNPSCSLIGNETLGEIGDIAKQSGARVLVDEVYLDLLFEDAPQTSYKLGPEFVVTNSLTKVYGLSGLRCGWVLAEPDLARRMYRVNDLLGVNNPYLTDQLSCIALAHLDEIAKWSRELLDRNRALANDALKTMPGLRCDPLRVGTVLFPKLEIPVEEFCRLLRERYDTVVTPGKFFGAAEHVRIGIGGETSTLTEGLSRIREALAEMANNG